MNEIKIYEQLTEVETFGWIIYTPATPEQLDEMLEVRKFVQIGDRRIAVHQIKSYGLKKLDSMEWFIIWLPEDIQKKVRQREKEKIERIWKWFESIEEIQRYIDNNVLPIKIKKAYEDDPYNT